MIKDLYFISGLSPFLAKSSLGLITAFAYVHLPMDDCHFGYKQKSLKT
jgi:hypothetical protein